MSAVLRYVRHNQLSSGTPGLVLMAMLGVLLAPCADALETPPQDNNASVAIHHDCPGSTRSEPTGASDCCSDLEELLSTKQNELRNNATVAGPPNTVDQPCFTRPELADDLVAARHATAPPIFLTTQRLRL